MYNGNLDQNKIYI